MEKCCWDCCKFILFIINFAALLAVGAVLGGVIYAIVKSKDVFNFHIDFDLSKDNENAILLTLLLIIIVVFGFLVIFTFLGCCGAACQNQCMLGSFIIILFIFLGANVAGIVYLFYHFDNEVEMAKHELEQTYVYYDPQDKGSISKMFWDYIQTNLGCCGAENYLEWAAATNLKDESKKVPDSCCKTADSDCQSHQTSENIYIDGCVDKIELPFRIIFWAIPSLMAFVLMSALIVCSRTKTTSSGRSVRNKRRHSHSGDYSEETGYVYRASATPDYPTAPPYNPDYPPHQNPYAAEQYPTGVIPPNADYRQPLIQPPPYHDVVNRR